MGKSRFGEGRCGLENELSILSPTSKSCLQFNFSRKSSYQSSVCNPDCRLKQWLLTLEQSKPGKSLGFVSGKYAPVSSAAWPGMKRRGSAAKLTVIPELC